MRGGAIPDRDRREVLQKPRFADRPGQAGERLAEG